MTYNLLNTKKKICVSVQLFTGFATAELYRKTNEVYKITKNAIGN
jgi:hypothetical protein